MKRKRIIFAFFILAGLALFGGGYVLARSLRGLPRPSLAAHGEVVGERGPVGIVFNQEMDKQSVEKAFSIDPAVKGHFTWVSNTLWFLPEQPLAAETAYTVSMAAGARSSDGRTSNRDETWTIKVRAPDVIYLSPAGETADLWVKPVGGEAARQLTQGKVVYDFGVSNDGEQVAYSALNAEKGYDLWIVGRDGSQVRKVLACGSDRCTSPAWRADGARIAYSRSGAKNGLENPTTTAHSQQLTPAPNVTSTGQPRIWTLDLVSAQSQPVYADPQITGTGPVWSPDGRMLAFVDLGEGGVRIFNFDSGADLFLPANTPVIGSWSANSAHLIYSDLDTAALPSFGAAFEVAIPLGQVTPLFASGPANADYNVPLLSPDGKWYLVGMRVVGGNPSRQLWLLSQDGSQQMAVGDDPLVTHAAYSWSPDGSKLVYQQLVLGSSSAAPEVWVWNLASNAFTRIAENATHPQWLP